MTVFADYAEYYDLFYRDKDYKGEAAFVAGLIRRHARGAHRILELGCGTARHALELVRGGYSVTGIDLSAKMVSAGREAAAALPAGLRGNFEILQGDATNFELTTSHDAVISLFHVVNYQTTNPALAAMFRTARRSIRKRGVFVFDYWYGPAVLSDRPAVRIKRVSTSTSRITRLAEPTMNVNANTVDVHYTLVVEDKRSGRMKEFTEAHSMRYLFLPEIQALAAAAGFELVRAGEWMTHRPLSDRTWFGYAVARAI